MRVGVWCYEYGGAYTLVRYDGVEAWMFTTNSLHLLEEEHHTVAILPLGESTVVLFPWKPRYVYEAIGSMENGNRFLGLGVPIDAGLWTLPLLWKFEGQDPYEFGGFLHHRPVIWHGKSVEVVAFLDADIKCLVLTIFFSLHY